MHINLPMSFDDRASLEIFNTESVTSAGTTVTNITLYHTIGAYFNHSLIRQYELAAAAKASSSYTHKSCMTLCWLNH